MVAYVPFQYWITGKLTGFRRAANLYADKRIKIIQEVMLGIRVIKIYAWEHSFLQLLSSLRASELFHVRGFLMARASVSSITQVVPTFAMLFSFVCYSLLGNPFSPAKIFASLSLFYALRIPMLFLPIVLTQATDAWVAATRIGALLLAPELSTGPALLPASDEPDEPAVHVKDASFEWEQVMDASAASAQGKKPKKSKKSKAAEQLKESADASSSRSPSPQPQPQSVFKIENLNLSIPRGKLVAVVGSVGSGKSSLLNALVGEMRRTAGSVTFRGTVGYCQQQAWIQNASVRDNILFGLPYDADKYARVLRDCSLERDLTILPGGDATEIGERGINLSGGQKQRVSIARAVYFDPDIVLLDDPLSAVDAHVGRYLFENCIVKALHGKTRVLVTHQLHFLPAVDYIVVMDAGAVVAQGTFEQLMGSSTRFATLMKEYGGLEESDGSDNDDDDSNSDDGAGDPADVLPVSAKRIAGDLVVIEDSTDVNPNIDASEGKLAPRRSRDALAAKSRESMSSARDKTAKGDTKPVVNNAIMKAEERNTGAVSAHFYLSYGNLAGGTIVYVTMAGLLVLANTSRIMTDQWLAYWTSGRFGLKRDEYIGIYVGLGLFQVTANLAYGLTVAYFGAIASQHIHDDALAGVLRSPISFFDSTPLGRITSRFSRDVDGVDNLLPESVRVVFFTFTLCMSNLVLISSVFPWFIVAVFPVLYAYYMLQSYYRATARELKRLDSVSRSPLIANVSEMLSGLATIRAYDAAQRFRVKNMALLDENNKAYYLSLLIQRWIQLNLEALNSGVVLAVAIMAVVSKRSIGPAAAGLVLSYALQITSTFNWCIKMATDVEINMNSAERLIHYIEELEPEAAEVIEPGSVAATAPAVAVGKTADAGQNGIAMASFAAFSPEWPTHGQIEARDIVLRYRPDLPPVLHGVSFIVQPGQKVGIVGRTGAGKSTILSALLRLFELDSGSLVIDGVDISKIGLRDLRQRVGVIPQEPVLFSGTIRSNLDPFQQYDDAALWEALERADLKTSIAQLPEGLDAPVSENGENWSTGQRQLLCLSRAVLKRARILLLDEATASVDLATDEFIQSAIRRPDFDGVTVITIAHRLNTIADYDRILVLGEGRVLEYDSPARLLGDPQGQFSQMVAETGASNAAMIRAIATETAARASPHA
ncbi:P-loop containing nucleoside triphosphate hydrolase protein [Entophlyctis helioformis]|nr:P-loop containing nucleoside triphosphate hydrolase protein [Entophlyctis helioformis]